MPAQTQVHIELSISVTIANINIEKASLSMISAEIISAREADFLAQHSSGWDRGHDVQSKDATKSERVLGTENWQEPWFSMDWTSLNGTACL